MFGEREPLTGSDGYVECGSKQLFLRCGWVDDGHHPYDEAAFFKEVSPETMAAAVLEYIQENKILTKKLVENLEWQIREIEASYALSCRQAHGYLKEYREAKEELEGIEVPEDEELPSYDPPPTIDRIPDPPDLPIFSEEGVQTLLEETKNYGTTGVVFGRHFFYNLQCDLRRRNYRSLDSWKKQVMERCREISSTNMQIWDLTRSLKKKIIIARMDKTLAEIGWYVLSSAEWD